MEDKGGKKMKSLSWGGLSQKGFGAGIREERSSPTREKNESLGQNERGRGKNPVYWKTSQTNPKAETESWLGSNNPQINKRSKN